VFCAIRNRVSLPPLADALKLDAGNSERELIHRIRLAALLRESPRLRDMWNAGSDVRSLAVNADHSLAAAGCDGGEVRLFDLRGRRQAHTLLRGAGSVVELSFSPNGRRLATVDQAGSARVWDAATGRPLSPGRRYP
jgi:WD40 repeat protein